MKRICLLVCLICVIFAGCNSRNISDNDILDRISGLETSMGKISNELVESNSLNMELIEEIQTRLERISEENETVRDTNESDNSSESYDSNVESNFIELQSQVNSIEVLIEDYIRINSSQWLFDPSLISIGDTINGFKLIDMEFNPDGMFKNRGDYFFDGEKEITGTYKIIEDDGFMDNVVSFSLTDYGPELPRVYNDGRTAWFTFTNYEEALDMLGSDSDSDTGIATIIISEYRIVLQPSDVNNTAKLVRVIKK